MSQGESCKCAGKKNRRKYHRVIDRNCNYSAFNGYHYTYSDYSAIVCLACGSHWRSKAVYVKSLPDALESEREDWIHNRLVSTGQ